MKQKNTPSLSSILVYVGILLFVLAYDKFASGNPVKDSIIALLVAAGVYFTFALLRFLKNKK